VERAVENHLRLSPRLDELHAYPFVCGIPLRLTEWTDSLGSGTGPRDEFIGTGEGFTFSVREDCRNVDARL
jgi:hypothetical protein